MAVGMVAYIAVGVDSSTSATAAYSSATVDFLAFQSETLDVNREDLFSPNIRAQFDEEARYNGLQRPGGNISGVIHHATIGYLLRSAFDATTAMTTASGGAGVRAHRFTTKNTQFHCGSGSDLPTITLEVYRGPCIPDAANIGSAFVFYNMAGNTLELSLDAGGMYRFSIDMLGRDYGVKGNQLPNYVPPAAFLWSQVSLSLGGAGSAIFTSFNVRLENNIQGVAKIENKLRPDFLKRQDFRRVSASGGATFNGLAAGGNDDYTRFIGGSETQVFLYATGADIVGGTQPAAMKIDLPRFVYQAFPIGAQGPGLIPVNFQARGMLDPTSRYSLEVTVTTSRVSAYSVNAAI